MHDACMVLYHGQSPRAIAANTTYIASYHSSGTYVATNNFFTSAVNSGQLDFRHAPASGFPRCQSRPRIFWSARTQEREGGAETSVYLSSSPNVDRISGKYFENCHEREPDEAAEDDNADARLWQESEKLAGLKMP
jgi:Domain of unknown function (DUF4082)